MRLRILPSTNWGSYQQKCQIFGPLAPACEAGLYVADTWKSKKKNAAPIQKAVVQQPRDWLDKLEGMVTMGVIGLLIYVGYRVYREIS